MIHIYLATKINNLEMIPKGEGSSERLEHNSNLLVCMSLIRWFQCTESARMN
jgi:hypothetical protein